MTHLHKLLRPLLVLMIAVSMVAPPFFIAATPRVEAQSGIVGCIAGLFGVAGFGKTFGLAQLATVATNVVGTSLTFDLVPNSTLEGTDITLTDNTTAAADSGQVFKECLLDALAWIAKNMIIPALTASIVDWINSGFEGGPTFIQDPQTFFIDMADYMAGQFIFESGLEFLCSPFQIDVMIDLAIDYYTPRGGAQGTLACTLSDVVANVEGFLAGDFMEGGFPGWFEMVMNPQNNPYGAALEAQSTLALRINNKALVETDLLSWAGGFFSSRNEETGQVETPGTYIKSQLNEWTSSPLAQLVTADELDEIIGALFSQLVQTILTEGLTEASYARPEGSYLERITRESAEPCTASKAELTEKISALTTSETTSGNTENLVGLNELSARLAALDCTDPVAFAADFAQIQGALYGVEALINARDAVQGVTITATPETGASPLTVTFSATVASSTGAVTTYEWNFGDGTSGTGNPVSHTYTRAGTYLAAVQTSTGLSRGVATVTITVTGEGGVNDPPTTPGVPPPPSTPTPTPPPPVTPTPPPPPPAP